MQKTSAEPRKNFNHRYYSTNTALNGIADQSNLMYKTCREKANLTQKESYYRVDIKDVSQLSRYENGRVTPPDNVVLKMAELYGDDRLILHHVRRIHPELADYIFFPPADTGRLREIGRELTVKVTELTAAVDNFLNEF